VLPALLHILPGQDLGALGIGAVRDLVVGAHCHDLMTFALTVLRIPRARRAVQNERALNEKLADVLDPGRYSERTSAQ